MLDDRLWQRFLHVWVRWVTVGCPRKHLRLCSSIHPDAFLYSSSCQIVAALSSTLRLGAETVHESTFIAVPIEHEEAQLWEPCTDFSLQ